MPVAAGLHYFLHEGGSFSRPPLVLIHGEAGDHLVWPSELRRLPGFRIFSLDLPGHGRSEGPGLQTVSGYARRVRDFMDAAGLSRAVLAGHGMGGGVALTLACEAPDRVCGLLLIGAGACLPVSSFLLENAANPSTFPLALQALQSAVINPGLDSQLRDQLTRRLSAVRPTLLYGDLLACDGFDLTDRLGTIRTPTLVVCGTEDKFAPLRYSDTLARSITGAALQTIDGAGHLPKLEQPHRLAGLVKIFLGTIAYTPGE